MTPLFFKNLTMKFLKTTRGNYRCYYKGHRIFVQKMMHGGWASDIIKDGIIVGFNGFHTTSMPHLKHVREWIKTKIG